MEDVIKKCKTIAEAIKIIYGYDNGNNRKKFYNFLEKNKIDISHLKKKNLIYDKINKECPVCGSKFETTINPKRNKVTCSYSCSNTYFRSGNNNPNWKDERYRSTCFLYHKKECIICGETKIVAVHHYDENKKNNEPENLIPLCPTHHQYVHSLYKNDVIGKIEEYRNNFLSNKNI